MKKFYLFLFLFFGLTSVFAQTSITLTFIGRDSLTQNIISFDSIYILNLTENCDTTISDSVPTIIVNALWPVGMNEYKVSQPRDFLLHQNYPNPFQGSTTVNLYRNYSGMLHLILFDDKGIKVAEFQHEFEKGFHSFAVLSSGNKALILNVLDEKNNRSIKIISSGRVNEPYTIQYLGQIGKIEETGFKNAYSSNFIFYLGNQMQYTAYAHGYNEKTITDSPSVDTTYYFNMPMISTPVVTTVSITDITQTTATSGGDVTSEGGAPVTVRGVCWNTYPNPTTSNAYSVNGSGTGTFISFLTNLSPNTAYYVRAYATNMEGTGYGNEISFTSGQGAPVVTTTTVTNISDSSATSGGNVISDGGSAVSARGVCWSTSPNPTTDSSHTVDGTGSGTFFSNITGLTPDTQYFLRAYAVNGIGTSYGNELTFTTLPLLSCGEVVSYEGKNYNTILINNQCWFKENLNVGVKISGSLNQGDNGIKEKYCYDDLESKCDTFGGLYQWDETMQYTTVMGSQGLCPNGWHIPADAEWSPLVYYLGGENVAGGKMKEAGTVHWAPPNTGATNSSGFTALPSGVNWFPYQFYQLPYSTSFWASSEHNYSFKYGRSLHSSLEQVIKCDSLKTYGFALRCIKNGSNSLPWISTADASNITQTSVLCGGNVIYEGWSAVTLRGVCWSTSPYPTTSSNHTIDGGGAGMFVSNITGLAPQTTYYLRSYAVNNMGTSYGNEVSFTTCSTGFCIGQSYGGGIIFYIDGTGQHGLISATTDQSTNATWGCEGTYINGTSTAIGTGQANTTRIINGCSSAGIAARICNDLVLNGFSDWFLPSRDELSQMFLNKNVIGGFTDEEYWSSSQVSYLQSFSINFNVGNYSAPHKLDPLYVRAIRAF
jgi:uncharacterized protein (TIGR02145 family)